MCVGFVLGYICCSNYGASSRGCPHAQELWKLTHLASKKCRGLSSVGQALCVVVDTRRVEVSVGVALG